MRRRITVSHLTIAQAARFIGVTQPSAFARLRDACILEWGVWMVPADAVRTWYRERLKAGRVS
jgi:hypothetical protein